MDDADPEPNQSRYVVLSGSTAALSIFLIGNLAMVIVGIWVACIGGTTKLMSLPRLPCRVVLFGLIRVALNRFGSSFTPYAMYLALLFAANLVAFALHDCRGGRVTGPSFD